MKWNFFSPSSQNCNRCRCAANGIGWFCTRRACPPQHRHQRQAPPTECTPGTSWSDGCNTCYCSGEIFPSNLIMSSHQLKFWLLFPDTIEENRTPRCTERFCFRRKRSAPSPERRCTPGHHWKNDCNDCFCTETGVAACTLRGCLHYGRLGPPNINVIHINRNHTHPGNSSRRNEASP